MCYSFGYMQMKTRSFSLLVVIVGCLFWHASTAQAALTLTSGANATTTPNVATSITGFQIVGPSASTTPVKLYTTSGTLSLGTTTGLTFDGASSGSVIYFSGTVANINAALSTLTYTRSSTGTDTLEVSLVNKGEVFFTGNDHLYKFIAGSYTWNAAKTAAEAQTAYGVSGYLATITSSAENTFISGRLTGDGWFGASDAATEGTWKWVTGPEAGTTFWQGTGSGSTVGGNYAHWNTGEPNDSGGNEDCAETYVSSGFWNDLNCTGNTLGYVVEFGAPGALPTVVAKNISIVTADVPAVTTLSPANAATGVHTSANLVLGFSKTVTTGTGTISIKKASDDSTVESIDVTGGQVNGSGSTSITINPGVTLQDNTEYYVLVPGTAFKDTSNNYFNGIAATTTWRFTTGDFTAPVITAVAASSTASTSQVITWTTNERSSTRVTYGPTNAYGTSTALTDTAPQVTNHSVTLTGLLPCATYNYTVTSADSSANNASSTNATFTTAGCTAAVTPTAATSTAITSSAGGSTSLRKSNATITVSAPSSFTATSSSVVIQIHALANTNVLDDIGTPNSQTNVGSVVFDVKAIINQTTTLDSFDAPVTITYQYTDADIAGLDESSLRLYHYHNGAWAALDSCSVDAAANTITCTTPSFSIFSLFGTPTAAAASAHITSTKVHYGCTDPKALNYLPSVQSRPELCRYQHIADTATTTTVTQLQNQLRQLIEQNLPLLKQAWQAGVTMPSFVTSLLNTTTSAHRSTSTTTAISVRDLTLGMEGSDVKDLQQYLIGQQTGPAAAELQRVGATGYFGQYTKNALGEYQVAADIRPAAGYYGPVTRAYRENQT